MGAVANSTNWAEDEWKERKNALEVKTTNILQLILQFSVYVV